MPEDTKLRMLRRRRKTQMQREDWSRFVTHYVYCPKCGKQLKLMAPWALMTRR
jgi:hypothetical protein